MYYSGNRFLSQSEMEVNAQYIYDYLSARGWTKNAICGMLGNMQTESTINPGIWEGLDDSDPSRGFGLVQWTPSTKYTSWCTSNGLAPAEMDSNLQRILYEVENGLQWISTASYPLSFEEFIVSTETPTYLADAFLKNYERPADQTQPHRGTQAEAWFSFLQGVTPTPSPKKKRLKPYMMIKKGRRYLIS